MDDKDAMEVLIKIIEKYPLDDKEKEAVMKAVGILSWTSLREGVKKAIKAKREKKVRL